MPSQRPFRAHRNSAPPFFLRTLLDAAKGKVTRGIYQLTVLLGFLQSGTAHAL